MDAALRIVAAPLLALCLSEAALAPSAFAAEGGGAPSGRETLRGGATLSWRVGEDARAAFGLAVPAFAQWEADGFGQPVTVRMRATGLAAVDAWQLSFHRSGDTAFERPLHRFRGTALTLHRPVDWDGRIEGGPPLRPGERLVAVLEVRDTAGNIERAPPQDMLVARYRMRRETRRIDALDATRAEALEDGAAPETPLIPLRGPTVTFRVDGWEEDDPPRVSGLPMEEEGSAWTLRQFLPGGAYDPVVQVARPLIDGIREIPVGTARIDVPPGAPLRAAVKGTGALDRIEAEAVAMPEGLRADGFVDGAAAARLILTNRSVGEDRLAAALVDPAAPAALAKDRRKRRSLMVGQGAATALWAGGAALPAPSRPLPEPRARRIAFTLDGPFDPALALPHADILPGSMRLVPADGEPLVPGRHYMADFGEGRLLLRETALSRLAEGALDVRYEVNAFAPRNPAPTTAPQTNPLHDRTWGAAAMDRSGTVETGRDEGGPIRRLLDWIAGKS